MGDFLVPLSYGASVSFSNHLVFHHLLTFKKVGPSETIGLSRTNPGHNHPWCICNVLDI